MARGLLVLLEVQTSIWASRCRACRCKTIGLTYVPPRSESLGYPTWALKRRRCWSVILSVLQCCEGVAVVLDPGRGVNVGVAACWRAAV